MAEKKQTDEHKALLFRISEIQNKDRGTGDPITAMHDRMEGALNTLEGLTPDGGGDTIMDALATLREVQTWLYEGISFNLTHPYDGDPVNPGIMLLSAWELFDYADKLLDGVDDKTIPQLSAAHLAIHDGLWNFLASVLHQNGKQGDKPKLVEVRTDDLTAILEDADPCPTWHNAGRYHKGPCTADCKPKCGKCDGAGGFGDSPGGKYWQPCDCQGKEGE